ncbi:C-C chemokine receptor type 5 isoform X2 [Danio rerio]|nr:C-C chemokine receptor type 5-like [Danio rerio]|eukprot:XP_021325909.1 C-C chemokine receptor type 5-like [Danio rerio]
MEASNSTPLPYEDYSPGVWQCSPIGTNDFGRTFLPPFYYIIFIISILGNGVVLLVVHKFEKMNTITNIFLINLVASNIIFTLTLPFYAVYHSSEWIFGEPMCKLVTSAYYLGFYSSILFLTLMTFDRYLAVVHCIMANSQRRSIYAASLSVAVWIISLLASLEYLIYFTVEESQVGGLSCNDPRVGEWKTFALYKQFVLFFLFPLVVFVYCYSRITLTVMHTRMVKKHHTIRVIFVTVLMFFVFWSPYNIVLVMREYKDPNDCNSNLPHAVYVTNNVARLYFCINPVFYIFLGRKFQNRVREMCLKQDSCLTRQICGGRSIGSSS